MRARFLECTCNCMAGQLTIEVRIWGLTALFFFGVYSVPSIPIPGRSTTDHFA